MNMLPVLFIMHGGGPSFFFKAKPGSMFPPAGLDSSSPLCSLLRNSILQKHVKREAVRAVLVVSAHYETDDDSGGSSSSGGGGGDDDDVLDFHLIHPRQGQSHSLYYDYGGFPKEAYDLTWNKALPFPDDLVTRMEKLFEENRLKLRLDRRRGLDHGVFVPMMQIFPEDSHDAPIPLTQISIRSSLDPNEHIKLGRVLRKLREENVLIIGSGALTHNLGLFFRPEAADTAPKMKQFHDYCVDAVTRKTGKERLDLLTHVRERGPNFTYAHPRADHFVPFIVAAAAADDDKPAEMILEGFVGALDVSCFLFN